MDMKFGDSAAGVWFKEVYDSCIRETSTGKWSIDMSHLVHKCLAEPKNAQITMQFLAQELRKKLAGCSVSEAPKDAWSDRLMLGSIYMAYAVSRDVAAGREARLRGRYPAAFRRRPGALLLHRQSRPFSDLRSRRGREEPSPSDPRGGKRRRQL